MNTNILRQRIKLNIRRKTIYILYSFIVFLFLFTLGRLLIMLVFVLKVTRDITKPIVSSWLVRYEDKIMQREGLKYKLNFLKFLLDSSLLLDIFTY